MRRPEQGVAGKALRVHTKDGHINTDDRTLTDCRYDYTGVTKKLLKEMFSPNVPAADNEVILHEPIPCFLLCSRSDPQPIHILSADETET